MSTHKKYIVVYTLTVECDTEVQAQAIIALGHTMSASVDDVIGGVEAIGQVHMRIDAPGEVGYRPPVDPSAN